VIRDSLAKGAGLPLDPVGMMVKGSHQREDGKRKGEEPKKLPVQTGEPSQSFPPARQCGRLEAFPDKMIDLKGRITSLGFIVCSPD
jgi:hypothetical protein